MITTIKQFKIKPGKVDVIKDWFNTIQTTRYEEAMETIRQENVISEIWSISNDGQSVFYFQKAKDNHQSADKTIPINAEHHEIMHECFEFPPMIYTVNADFEN